MTQNAGLEQSGLFCWEMPVAVFIEVSHLGPVRNFWNKTYFAHAKWRHFNLEINISVHPIFKAHMQVSQGCWRG